MKNRERQPYNEFEWDEILRREVEAAEVGEVAVAQVVEMRPATTEGQAELEVAA